MKKQNLIINMLLISVMFALVTTSCKKDDDKTDTFTLNSLTAGGIDINGATAPTNIPADATIEANYNMNVNAGSVDNKIFLIRNYDHDTVPVVTTVSGSKITIDPQETLGSGSQYQLTMLAGITASDGQTIGSATRSFTTVGSFAPNGTIAYWNFDDNVDDQVGTFNPASSGGIIDLTYAASLKTDLGKAGLFNGTTTLVRIPNGDQLMPDNFTLSFWMKSDTTKHGQFVMGLAGWFGFQFEIFGAFDACKLAAQYELADGTTASEDLWFNGTALNPPITWVGWTFQKDLTGSGGVQYLIADKWVNVVCKFNAATKVGTMYLNGEKMKEQDFNLWPEGEAKRNVIGLKYAGHAGNNTLVFGFIQDSNDPSIPDDWAKYEVPTNNHFKGLLDEVRIFDRALTEQEIQLMYNSQKP